MVSIIALIPARGGSERIPRKNLLAFAGHPLVSYSIAAAKESGIFKRVIVSTDDPETAEVSRKYGAEVPFMRPAELAGRESPDIDWILHALKSLPEKYDAYAILRPTNPFRQAETIRRAWTVFLGNPGCHSLRAVERCRQHPGKMWRQSKELMEGVQERIFPIFHRPPEERQAVPLHDLQYQSLEEVLIQNGSLQISRTRVALEWKTMSGWIVVPFFTEGLEGFDINRPEDLVLANYYLEKGEARLPKI